MIEFNEIFLADLKDDFELAGKGEKEFSVYDFINKNLSKAFGIGYSIKDWKLWIPVQVRKELRHCSDNLEPYNAQLKWLNGKCDKKLTIEEYANFVLDNIFCDDELDLVNIAISLGSNVRSKYGN